MLKNLNYNSNQTFETELLIIGAGPVGLFAAFQAGLLGIKATVIDALNEIGGQPQALYPCKHIHDIPAHPKIAAKDLIDMLKEQASPYQPLFLMAQTAEKLDKTQDGEFILETSLKNKISAKAIIIAAGAGAFKPQPLPVSNADEFENRSVFYHISEPDLFKDKVVVIIGGGDSAVDWTLHLGNNIAKKVYLVHRRNNFRALPASVAALNEMNKHPHCSITVPYVIKHIAGEDGMVHTVTLQHFHNKEEHIIKADVILPFFGLTRDLGGINNWGLNLNTVNSTILVDLPNCETNVPGIFAVGDIAEYPNKLKLIMTGFSEVAYAVHAAWKYVFPDKKFKFTHSTSKG